MNTKIFNESTEFRNEIQLNSSIAENPQEGSSPNSSKIVTDELAEINAHPEYLMHCLPNNISTNDDLNQSESIEGLHLEITPTPKLKINYLSANIMKSNSFDVDIELVQPHSGVMNVYKTKDLKGLKLTMKAKGLLEPIEVVQRGEMYEIFEGISRFLAAKELGWETIPIVVFEFTDEEIQDQFVLRNYRTKRSIAELTDHAEIILGVLGMSQGKKRERIGDIDLADDDFSMVGKDRFEIAREIIGADISASSLRRLISVKEFVDSGDDQVKKLNLIERLDSGSMKINQALNVINSYKTCKKQEGTNEITETLKEISSGNYDLYNKSCEDLSDLEDESIDSIVESCPYYNQKDYTRAETIENQIGLEKTVDEFVAKQVDIHLGVYKKLKKSGSLFIVIADSYDNGVDCLVVEKLTIKMVERGWKFIQKWYWVKDNPKPQNNLKRLMPNYEYVLHFVKDVKSYYWREFLNWKDGDYKVMKGSNERELSRKRKNYSWTLKKPIERFRSFLSEQNVAQVIHANGFTWNELKEINPDFRHQAPYPSYIPLLPILLTTKVGDTVLDIYNGTSTTTAVALQLGRKAIGYDIDKVNHQFAAKRLQMVERNLPDLNEVIAFESEFFEDSDGKNLAA